MPKKEKIRSCFLFSGLDDSQIERLQTLVEIREYPKKSFIFNQGDPAQGMFYQLSGRAKVFKLSADGKEQILRIVEPGELFAEAAVFSGQSYPAFAAALTKCETLFIPRQGFLKLLQQYPELGLKIIATMSGLLRKLNSIIEELALKQVPARLAKYLLELRNKAGQDKFSLTIKKTDLALMLGTSPETLSRSLRRLKTQRLIEISGSKITILNLAGLEELAHGLKP